MKTTDLKKHAQASGGYSLARAVRSAINRGSEPDGLEGTISQELCKDDPSSGTFRIPHWAFGETRTMSFEGGSNTYTSNTRDLTAGGEGAEIVAEDVAETMPALRPSGIVRKFGVRVLTGLRGNLKMPRIGTATSVAWATDEITTAYVESEPAFDETTLTPSQLGSTTQYSKQLLVQSGGGIERILRDDITRSLSQEIDVTLVEGSGSAGEPTGITNTASVGTVTITTAGTPDKAELFEYISDISAANAMGDGNLGWVTTPALASTLKQTLWESGIAGYMLDHDTNNMLGSPVLEHSGLAANTLVFGNWDTCVVAFWGNGVDLIVDPYTDSKFRKVNVTSNVLVDVALLQPTAFSKNA